MTKTERAERRTDRWWALAGWAITVAALAAFFMLLWASDAGAQEIDTSAGGEMVSVPEPAEMRELARTGIRLVGLVALIMVGTLAIIVGLGLVRWRR